VTVSSTTDTSKIAKIVEGILARESREDLVAARAAEELAERQAAARTAIAAISPERSRVARAWFAQVAKTRTLLDDLLAANATLREIAEADDALYSEQDRLRFSASVPDPLVPRVPGALPPFDHLSRALAESEDQARRALEVPR
jgi:hypothetical protein